jgi:ElaB/YqjD/DUF883 family membrane-anchored ribosome-binding protein
MTTTTKSLRAGTSTAHSYADDALSTASQALEKAGETVRELRSGARDLAGKGLSSVSDKAAAAQRQLGHYIEATGRYASDQPVKTALIAAAVGAIVAGVIIAARRRRQHY